MSQQIFRTINLSNTKSELDYDVSGKASFGTLACTGKNEIGEQKMPCLFQLLPKGIFRTFCYYFSNISQTSFKSFKENKTLLLRLMCIYRKLRRRQKMKNTIKNKS